jgi:HEPN domain-containing protein
MRTEAARWLKQAEADLKVARDSKNSINFESCCFKEQQSAEKALKVLLYNNAYNSLTSHSVKLILIKKRNIYYDFLNISEEARLLDAYYIQTHYPNGLDPDIDPVD